MNTSENTTPEQVRAKAVASARERAAEAVQTVEDAAHETLENAEQQVKEWRRDASPAIHNLASRAQDFASRSIDYCAHTSERAHQKLQHAREATYRYVEAEPTKALMLASAAGAAVASLIILASRRSR